MKFYFSLYCHKAETQETGSTGIARTDEAQIGSNCPLRKEKIIKVLEKSPYKVGDVIKGEFIIRGDSIELTLGCGTYLFDEEGDLLMMITPRESE